MSNFIYYEKLEDYEEQVRKAKECDEKDKEINELKSIIRRAKEKVKSVKEINNEIYKQTDMLERFYSRKWCNDVMDNFLEILGSDKE